MERASGKKNRSHWERINGRLFQEQKSKTFQALSVQTLTEMCQTEAGIIFVVESKLHVVYCRHSVSRNEVCKMWLKALDEASK